MPDQIAPQGQLAISTVAMPADTNANGDIFGGWLVSHMDMAGGIEGRRISHSRVVTVAIDAMQFIHPVSIGDTVQCYVSVIKIGRTSIQFKIEAWTTSLYEERYKKVAAGVFTFVAIDDEGKPRLVHR